MQKATRLNLSLLLSALVLGLSGSPAPAQDHVVVQDSANPVESPASPVVPDMSVIQPSMPNNDLLPPVRAVTPEDNIDESQPTHAVVKLTPDKSELIRLGGPAKTVLVGNPAHLSVLPEGPDTLVLIPKAPGATYFTVLNEDGQVIMQRHVIVASPKEKYVRIRKSCAATEGCQPTQVYYCPDMCHEIILNAEQAKGSTKTAKSDAVSSEISEAAEEESSPPENSETGGEDSVE